MPSGVCHTRSSSEPPGALFAAARRQSSRVRSGYRGTSEFAMSSPCPWSDPAPCGHLPPAQARHGHRAQRAGARNCGGLRPAPIAEPGNRSILLQRGLPFYPFPGAGGHPGHRPARLMRLAPAVTMAHAPPSRIDRHAIASPADCCAGPGFVQGFARRRAVCAALARACGALARRQFAPPMADGGEGTLDAVLRRRSPPSSPPPRHPTHTTPSRRAPTPHPHTPQPPPPHPPHPLAPSRTGC